MKNPNHPNHVYPHVEWESSNMGVLSLKDFETCDFDSCLVRILNYPSCSTETLLLRLDSDWFSIQYDSVY